MITIKPQNPPIPINHLQDCILSSSDNQSHQQQFQEQDNHHITKPLIRYNSSDNKNNKHFVQINQIHFRNQETIQKLRKLKELRRQRQKLQYSLQILKTSAIMALVQKQDQISRLKNLTSLNQTQKLQYFQTQLSNSHKIQHQLKQKEQQLHLQLRQQRSKFLDELQQRQDLIQNLHGEITEIQQQIQKCRTIQEYKQAKIKSLQEDNSKLFLELEFSTLNISLKEHRQNHVNFKLHSEQSVMSSIHHKSSASLQQQDRLSHHYHNHNHHAGEHEKTYLSAKLQEIAKNNKEQLQDLKYFYEKRICDLRQIYQKQFIDSNDHSPPHLLSNQDEQLQIQINHISQSQYQTQLSNHHNYGNHKHKYSHTPHSNNNYMMLNLQSMYPIEQNVEDLLQTSRDRMNSLKFEIKNQNNLQNYTHMTRQHILITTTEDNQSQFTSKYFENPFRFMRKNKSTETLSVQNDDQEKTLAKQYNQCMDKKQKQEREEMGLWGKTCIFGVGLLSGVAITALVFSLMRRDAS